MEPSIILQLLFSETAARVRIFHFLNGHLDRVQVRVQGLTLISKIASFSVTNTSNLLLRNFLHSTNYISPLLFIFDEIDKIDHKTKRVICTG